MEMPTTQEPIVWISLIFGHSAKQSKVERCLERIRTALLQKCKFRFIRMPIIHHSQSFSLLPEGNLNSVAIFIKMSRMAIQISNWSLLLLFRSSPVIRRLVPPSPSFPFTLFSISRQKYYRRTNNNNKINTHWPHHRKVVNQAKNTCIRISISVRFAFESLLRAGNWLYVYKSTTTIVSSTSSPSFS